MCVVLLWQDSSKNRAGPYSFAELKSLYSEGAVTAKTLVWAQGMDGWKGVVAVSQLKWSLVAQVNIFSIFVLTAGSAPKVGVNDCTFLYHIKMNILYYIFCFSG